MRTSKQQTNAKGLRRRKRKAESQRKWDIIKERSAGALIEAAVPPQEGSNA